MNTYELITLVCFITAGVFFVISAVLFFVLDMVKVIGDLTGHTAKREIENIRSQNQKTGNKAYKPSKVNAERGKLTDKISQSGKILKKQPNVIGGSVGTEKINADSRYSGYEETSLLEDEQNDGAETTLLEQNGLNSPETTVLGQASSETTVLSPGGVSENTTVLNGASSIDETSLLNGNVTVVAVSVLQEIKIINTEEMIY